MAYTLNKGFPAVSALLGTSAGGVYTAPAAPLQSSKPSKCTVINTTGSTRTISCWLVRSGDSAAAKNQLVVNEPIPANSSLDIAEVVGQTLMPGDSIQFSCDAASAVNVEGSTVEQYSN